MEEDDPPLGVRGPADGGTDDLLTADGDDGMVVLARRDDLGQRIDGGGGGGLRRLPEADDPVEVVVVEIADACAAHRTLLRCSRHGA